MLSCSASTCYNQFSYLAWKKGFSILGLRGYSLGAIGLVLIPVSRSLRLTVTSITTIDFLDRTGPFPFHLYQKGKDIAP